MDLKKFASEEYPFRCSRLPSLMSCPWKVVMEFLNIHTREGGSAAQTGTATHRAIQSYHTNGKEVRKAVKAMRAARDEYPMADLLEAERLFCLYAEDPRNQQAKVVAVETYIQARSGDVVLKGHIDQIREVERGLEVWDPKTSKFEGAKILNEHWFQIAGYCYLASKHFARSVHPGGVIMVRGYDKGPDRVFYSYDLTYNDALRAMEMVLAQIQQIRRGRIIANPGDYCKYCVGLTSCMRRLDEYCSSSPETRSTPVYPSFGV